MAHEVKAESAYDYIFNIITPMLMIGAAIFSLYLYKEFFFGIWQVLRIVEFSLLSALQYPLRAVGFYGEASEGLRLLLSRTPNHLSFDLIFQFERHYNNHLRFIYASIIFFTAWRTYKNYHKVTHKFDLEGIMGLYASQSEMLNQLMHDNPLNHPIKFQFDNRSDYANRYSKNVSPSEFLNCNPILLATPEELQKAADPKSTSRPICIFDRQNKTFDFNQRLCETSLKRQLTGIPYQKPFYSNIDDVPRLFDKKGKLVPLKTEKRSGKTVYIGNFRVNNLINNGFKFKGSDDELPLLFTGNERWVFEYLRDSYKGKSYTFNQAARDLLDCHAYSRTFFVELLSVTRNPKGGAATIASTEFKRVKQRDRVLYYALLDSDEEMPSYDSIAVMAHHSMEKALKVKSTKIYIASAVRVLRADAQRLSNWVAPDSDVVSRDKYSFKINDDEAVKEQLKSAFEIDVTDLAKQKRKQQEKAEVLL
ncbi:secretion/conjugation apparatus DotM-related subunit [Photobacterium leiognathi]|uniref:secretion/conjugation apparatus DotM-related subunit n=1 Tax=Photobacterium leiognathi TaxID=553611 RepID=UPI002981B4CF|nr:hypothetical protein [Photobacterium leiognathi]